MSQWLLELLLLLRYCITYKVVVHLALNHHMTYSCSSSYLFYYLLMSEMQYETFILCTLAKLVISENGTCSRCSTVWLWDVIQHLSGCTILTTIACICTQKNAMADTLAMHNHVIFYLHFITLSSFKRGKRDGHVLMSPASSLNIHNLRGNDLGVRQNWLNFLQVVVLQFSWSFLV